MAEKKIFVLDASVVVKWFTREPLREEAAAIRQMYLEGAIELEAPSLLFYEVINALRYNPVLGSEDVKKAAKLLEDMQITIHDFTEQLALKTIEIAYRYGITIYDAAYVALTMIRDAILYTADEEIVSKISKGNVKHLKEFRTSNGLLHDSGGRNDEDERDVRKKGERVRK